MFRKLILVAAAFVAVSTTPHHHFGSHHHDHTCNHTHDFGSGHLGFRPHPPGFGPPGKMEHWHQRFFNDVASLQQAVDMKVQSGCSRHSNGNTRELIDEGIYKVTTPLVGYAETDFTIKIKGRTLFVRASNAAAQYTEVRTLPTFISVASAAYMYDEGILSIFFPINNDATTCTPTFTDVEKTVPVYVNTGIAPRFGGEQ